MSRSDKPTPPDDWDAVTPTIPHAVVKPYIERIRKSSAATELAAGLCALEVLRLEGVRVEGDVETIESRATAIVRRQMHELYEHLLDELQKQNARLTTEYIEAVTAAKASARRTNGLRKAILDFERDGDLVKLKDAVYT